MHKHFFPLVLLQAACGAAQPDALAPPPDARAALIEPYVTAEHGLYSVKVEWLSGLPVPGEAGAARLTFLTRSGAPAKKVVVERASLWLPAREQTSPADPQVNEVTAQPGDVAELSGIVVPVAGAWELRLHAVVDGQADDVIVPFAASA